MVVLFWYYFQLWYDMQKLFFAINWKWIYSIVLKVESALLFTSSLLALKDRFNNKLVKNVLLITIVEKKSKSNDALASYVKNYQFSMRHLVFNIINWYKLNPEQNIWYDLSTWNKKYLRSRQFFKDSKVAVSVCHNTFLS